MPSPFPGMDPYLEPHWLDVHTSLVSGARDALKRQLPDDLIASAAERIAVEGDVEDRLLAPDVRIFEPPAESTSFIDQSTEGTTISLPFRLLVQVEPITERFIKIIDAGTERLVTVIELVSPTHSAAKG